MLRQVLNYVEYALLRCVAGLYQLVPARQAYRWGAGIAKFFYPWFKKRRVIAVDNILQAGICQTKAEADQIARRAFGHFVGHLFEVVKAGEVLTAENWRQYVVLDGPEESWRLLLEELEQPVMILSGHHGVWEIAGLVLGFERPMIAVARRMNNPLIERFLRRKHFRGDITIVPKSRGFSLDIIRQWQRRCAVLTLVMDQHAGSKQGIPVDFMGRPAYTHTSPARLHLATGAPILVGSFVREGVFKYRMLTESPIYHQPSGDREADTRHLSLEVNRRLERLIRRYPDQYLWAHKRWRPKKKRRIKAFCFYPPPGRTYIN